MTAPIISIHDVNDPRCYCAACLEAAEPGRFGRRCGVVLGCLILAALVFFAFSDTVWSKEPRPIKAPAALVHAREACPVDKPLACRAALVRALEAVAWQKQARLHPQVFGVAHALRIASALYGVPVVQLQRVGFCESRLDPRAKSRISTATGLFQFLDSTWKRAGVHGFPRTDPYANAIAAARLVRRDGSWREWSCGFRA